MANLILNGIPYSPGYARGKLQRYISKITAGDILIINQDEMTLLGDYKPAGLVVIDSAPFSHPMIQLLTMGIPIVIITKHQASQLSDDVYIQVSGLTGEIRQSTDTELFAYETVPIPVQGQSLSTIDGVEINLYASVSNSAAVSNAITHGASAIGLVRSEFLQPKFLQTKFLQIATAQQLNTDFYTRAFTELCEAALPLSVTIRLLDLAADKQPQWLPQLPGIQGPLGLQGARLYDNAAIKGVVRAQLVAISLLVSRYDLRVLIPYITTLKEYLYWRNFIQQLINYPMPIGVMAETPAALLDIGNLVKFADFVAIGTNDLMQSLFSADRDLPELRRYLNPYMPVLFRFLRQVARDAGGHNQKIQVCGLLSQWPGILPILIGLGYRTYSVAPIFIPYLAQTITAIHTKHAQDMAEQICAAADSETVGKILNLPFMSLWENEFGNSSASELSAYL